MTTGAEAGGRVKSVVFFWVNFVFFSFPLRSVLGFFLTRLFIFFTITEFGDDGSEADGGAKSVIIIILLSLGAWCLVLWTVGCPWDCLEQQQHEQQQSPGNDERRSAPRTQIFLPFLSSDFSSYVAFFCCSSCSFFVSPSDSLYFSTEYIFNCSHLVSHSRS